MEYGIVGFIVVSQLLFSHVNWVFHSLGTVHLGWVYTILAKATSLAVLLYVMKIGTAVDKLHFFTIWWYISCIHIQNIFQQVGRWFLLSSDNYELVTAVGIYQIFICNRNCLLGFWASERVLHDQMLWYSYVTIKVSFYECSCSNWTVHHKNTYCWMELIVQTKN